jgi:hypothetical protein
MDDQLNGRQIFNWQAQGPRDYQQWEKDINSLADAVSEAAPIYNHDGMLVWLKDGKLIQVAGNVLHEIIRQYVVTPQLVNNNGIWTCDYLPFVAPEQAVRTLLTAETRKDGSLIARAPKA